MIVLGFDIRGLFSQYQAASLYLNIAANRLPDLLGGGRRSGGPQVGGNVAGIEHLLDGLVHRTGFFGKAKAVLQERRDRADRTERIGFVLSGDVRGRTVYRLVQANPRAGRLLIADR